MPRGFWGFIAFFWMVLIYLLSSYPDSPGLSLLGLIPFGDKLAHGSAYGLLACWFYLATGRFWLSLVMASLYGVSDEFHQHFTPGRSVDILDWLADTTGALVLLIVVTFLTRRYPFAKESLEYAAE